MRPWAKFTKKQFRAYVAHIIWNPVGVMMWRHAMKIEQRQQLLADRAYAASDIEVSRKLRTPKTKVLWKLRA